MSGGKKSSTVGWRYFFALFMGLGRGPLDAIREIRVGDRTAWRGNVTDNTTINIDAPNLFGGEEKEGGIQGPLQILMGGPTQTATAELLSAFGSPLPGFRQVATAFFDGLLSMNNPYPKPWKFRVNRVLKGWDGEVFQPLLAQVPLDLTNAGDVMYERLIATWPLTTGQSALPGAAYSTTEQQYPISEDTTNIRFTEKGMLLGKYNSNDVQEFRMLLNYDPFTGEYDNIESEGRLAVSWELTDWKQTPANILNFVFFTGAVALFRNPANPAILYSVRVEIRFEYFAGMYQHRAYYISAGTGVGSITTLGPAPAYQATVVFDAIDKTVKLYFNGALAFTESFPIEYINWPLASVGGESSVNMSGNGNGCHYHIRNYQFFGTQKTTGVGANGAHIIYETLTNRQWGRGLSRDKLDQGSFSLAAASLVNEGFPLCMKWLRQDELKSFVQNVQNHIGSVIYTHRQTGLINLKLIRGDYEFDDLPVYDMSNGLLEIREASIGVVGRGVNTINVTWHDPFEDQPRSVTVKNGAAIQLAGGVINAATKTYNGCPTESLALRLGQRDLRASSTLVRKFVLIANRNLSHLHPGDVFAIQDLERGIPKMAVRVGKVKDGTLRDGKLQIDVIQDVFSLPSKSFASGAPSTHVPQDTTPCIDHQRVFEAPYFLLAARMAPADLDYVTDDGGYMAVVNSKGKATNVSIQIAVRDGASEPEDAPTDDSYFCSGG